MDYRGFFTKATGFAAFPYQCALAALALWPSAVQAATGAGKTAAIVLAFLWQVFLYFTGRSTRAPYRRLVYVLPQRSLVDQTVANVRKWIDRLGLDVHVVEMMGGSARDDWYLYPERFTIIVGVQDVLLSGAMNRAYAASPYLWPVIAGLLNSDSLWVYDEIQLAGVGLTTARQLEATRSKFGTYGGSASCYMSATLEASWLGTVDAPAPAEVFTLTQEDWDDTILKRRRYAPKPVRFGVAIAGSKDFAKAAAAEVAAEHLPNTRTLVVCNTIASAKGLYAKLARAVPKGTPTRILHSLFRPGDRKAIAEEVLAKTWTGILVSTQVAEAGLDFDARALFTEAAPWSNMVQRIGRCNRDGLCDGSAPALSASVTVWGLAPPPKSGADKAALPYHREDTEHATEILRRMPDASPASIEATGECFAVPPARHVLRRDDILALFDTSNEVHGYSANVADYVRDAAEDTDVRIFWRRPCRKDADLGEQQPPPRREELCPVPIGEAVAWARPKGARRSRLYRWDHLRRQWVIADQIIPGNVYMAPAMAGGYTPETGWYATAKPGKNGVPKSGVPVVEPTPTAAAEEPEDGNDADPHSTLAGPAARGNGWVTLKEHAEDTAFVAREIVASLPLPPEMGMVLVTAARAHDVGKIHEVFQRTMRRDFRGPGDPNAALWAKSGHRLGYDRRGFRHELASALTWIAVGPEEERDLIAYLLAAHHGKVRGRIWAQATDTEAPGGAAHARGIWDGDAMPAVDLGQGLVLPEHTLSLDIAPTGGTTSGTPNWGERVAGLLARLGPYRLLYLEAVVIAADRRATKMEDGR